jgi:hypothetical protein
MNRSFEGSRFSPVRHHAGQIDVLMNESAAAKLFLSFCLSLSVVFIFTLLPAYAGQIKTNNLNNLEPGSSWISGVAPAGNDYAVWSLGQPSAFPLAAQWQHRHFFSRPPGYDYQVECNTCLVDAIWLPPGNAISGGGTIHSLNDLADADSRFYRVQTR